MTTILKILQIHCLLWIFISSCSAQSLKPDCSHVRLTAADLKESNSKKILFLIADDRSASVAKSQDQPERITESQYREILETFIIHGYTGQFDINIIGNTPKSGFEKILTFDPLYEKKTIPKNATLTEKGKLRCINERIEDTCNKIIKSNRQKVDNYLVKIIIPKVINYKPTGPEATDIAKVFRDIEMRLESSKSYAYDKRIVVIMCDGKDSHSSSNLIIRNSVSFELILLGWPKDKKVKDNNDNHFDNVDVLINWFKTNKF